MVDPQRSYNSLIRCGKYTAAVVGGWTIWCCLMVAWPHVFGLPGIRAIARVSIVLLPALAFYLTGNREKSMLDYFQLREYWKRGVIVGAGVAILYFSIAWEARSDGGQITFHFPAGFAIWFNFILGSPLAEEAFFRGVLLQELQTRLGSTWAILLSAGAFALLHLPQWVILDNLVGADLLSSFTTIFVYGVVFAFLVTRTRSLWASLLPHWINNFILFALT